MTLDVAVTDCPAGFAHSAVIIAGDEDLRRTLGPHMRQCLAGGEDILLVVSEPTRAALSGEVADFADRVQWARPTAFYQRLGFAYEGFRRILAKRRADGRRLHVVAEPHLTDGAPVNRVAAYLAYEAACNDTYAPYGLEVTCIWNSSHHPDAVLAGVRATHGYELTPSGLAPSRDYLPPEQYLARHREPMTEPPVAVDHDLVLRDAGELGGLRGTLGEWSRGQGFAREAAEDVVVAAVEVATNGLHHATGPVRVRAWRDGDTVIVQCDDAGGGAVPVSAGYHRPDPAAATPGGRGLWLARQLADVVTVESAPEGTRVRLHFPYDVSHHD